LVCVAVVLLVGLVVVPAFAKGPNGPAGNSSVGHINMVEKDNLGPDGIYCNGDETWVVLSDAGKYRYQLSGTTLDVVLNAEGLVPGNWYYVELVDVSSGYNPIDYHSPAQAGDTCTFSQFYGQANGGGNVHIAFTWTGSITSGMVIEVNLKNADNVALLSPSTVGVPAEWILGTGQGWNCVLYSEATITVP